RRPRWRRGSNSSSLLRFLSALGRVSVVSWCGPGRSTGPSGLHVAGATALVTADAALVVDQSVQPAHLALDLLEPVALQLERVLVGPVPGAGGGLPHLLEPLGQARAASLEDAQPRLRVRLGEEREAHVEVLVLPRRRAGARQG